MTEHLPARLPKVMQHKPNTLVTARSPVMAALGLPHPFVLGLLGGVGELIHMVGLIAAGLVAVLAGAALSGAAGALLARPLAAALRVYPQWLVVPTIQGEMPPNPKDAPT